MNKSKIVAFQTLITNYYQTQGRHDLPWRQPEPDGAFDSYKILLSEIMLQQTQVPRVIPKYREFLTRFPTAHELAAAPLSEVLKAWSGLGYNRRAKYLHLAAQTLATKPQPWEYDDLVACKGIGPNTAAAVLVYSYNLPLVFIETNIRTVYIHQFFDDKTEVPDTTILDLVKQTVDKENPRAWYWSLMDYGTFLKQTVGNLNVRSKSYAKQSRFQGSLRQIRGAVIRELAAQNLTEAEFKARISDDRLSAVLEILQAEGLIVERDNYYQLA